MTKNKITDGGLSSLGELIAQLKSLKHLELYLEYINIIYYEIFFFFKLNLLYFSELTITKDGVLGLALVIEKCTGLNKLVIYTTYNIKYGNLKLII